MSEAKRIIEIKYKDRVCTVGIPDAYPDPFIEKIVERFANLFSFEGYPLYDIDEIDFIWCLVGNIVDKHSAGKDLGIKRGTKQFGPDTKVYCFPAGWGDGYEKIYVLGKPRKRMGLIKVIMQSRYIKNWRLQKVYDPNVISEMTHNFGWTNKEEDKKTIEEMLSWLPKVTIEELPLTDDEKKIITRDE